MRKTITFALLAVACIVACVLSVHAWDKYKVADRARAEFSRLQAEAAERERAEAEAAERARIKYICDQAQKAYDALPLSEQKQMQSPNCYLQEVQ